MLFLPDVKPWNHVELRQQTQVYSNPYDPLPPTRWKLQVNTLRDFIYQTLMDG